MSNLAPSCDAVAGDESLMEGGSAAFVISDRSALEIDARTDTGDGRDAPVYKRPVGSGNRAPRGLAPKRCLCSRCGHTWPIGDVNLKRCPGCGSYRWAEEVLECDCLRCGHHWRPRTGRPSARCPSCRSADWGMSDREFEVKTFSGAVRRMMDGQARHVPLTETATECGPMMDEAIRRCATGCGVYAVAVSLSVPMFDLMEELERRGIKYVIRCAQRTSASWRHWPS